MVLIRSEIWLIDTPNTAGPISLRILLTPGWRGLKRQRGRMPSLARAGSCKASCSTPPPNTAQASTSAGG